ncbi:MAG: CRTAC1 family protein [Luteitalea sp.]|nr:CRTAC1 family protein [Luteitalea sp.]
MPPFTVSPCHLVTLALVATVGGAVLAQTPPGAPAGGASTAGVFAPVKDKEARPITAGGFVEGAPVVFDDRTRGSGLDAFRHVSGSPEKGFILEAPSGGVALVDVDNDGWLDIYLLNGGTTDALEGRAEAPRAALLRNNGDLTFTDITARAGVANERWGFGVAAGDIDNDGWTDLYVTNFGENRLYRNNGDRTFTDVAKEMGVAEAGWSTGASFGDYDGDGRLDLFVAGYVDVDPRQPPTPKTLPDGRTSCAYRGEPVMCGPRGLEGAPNRLYRNDGSRFVDVTERAGVTDTARYYGFAVAWVDVDDDGKLDLLVVNDSTPNYLYRNRGDGTFDEVGFSSGFALNEEGREQAGMGLAIGDYDNDGDLDTYITNFSDDSNTLRRNDGEGTFVDVTAQRGLRAPTLPFLGWGTAFLDVDNDGWLDLFVANGHVYPQVDRFDWGMTWAQRPLLFRNHKGKRFEEVPAALGSGLAITASARGAAFGDVDRDGRVDVVVNNQDGPPTLLHNVSQAGHWLSIRLMGSSRGPRDAIGASVTIEAGGTRWRRDVISGGSYCSQSDLAAHVGLGRVTRIDAVTVRWPGGRAETFAVPGVDRIVTLVEGRGVPRAP